MITRYRWSRRWFGGGPEDISLRLSVMSVGPPRGLKFETLTRGADRRLSWFMPVSCSGSIAAGPTSPSPDFLSWITSPALELSWQGWVCPPF